ncbi:MAG: prepilin-type N-terminal cleavage/methylation domain-containing protein [Desulforegulaceae bacterium]|nr:prepilin-type N-terminal cleavage/methylation domain-containing protein [Desulforegulaceae bacterium]
MFLKKLDNPSGFTLIEIMIVIAIISILSAIAIPFMFNYIYKVKVVRTITEIKTIESALMLYNTENNQFPQDLDSIGFGSAKDVFGNPFRYTPIKGTKKGILRKNKFLVPVNTDFDLYSCGKDGKTTAPFTAKASKDDIVRANNGGFYGLVENY